MSEKTRRRRTVARHGQLRSPGALSQLLKIVGVVLAVVLVSGVGVVAFVGSTLIGDVTADAVELEGHESVPPDIGAFEGGFNLLLTGVDTCEPEYAHLFRERCTGADSEGTLNDVNMLVHVSDEPRRITAVSFPRDLMVPIPSCTAPDGTEYYGTDKGQLNTAYSAGGLNCVAKTISELTGQDIQFAAAVTFGGVIEITDAIGGVEVCLASSIRDRHTGLDLDAGTHTISGERALAFLRTRHGLVGESDLARIGNQQVYLNALVRKLRAEETLGDVPTVLRLANTGLSNIEASTSLTNPMLIAQIALAVKDVPFEDIAFLQYPVSTDPNDADRVVPIRSAATALFDAIAANQPFQITHEASRYDGVVVEEGEAPETTAPEPAPSAGPETTAPAPSQSAVALPESVKGTTVEQKTCSNGNGR
ncbi:LCP family protein [Microbacterium sp. CIAB417]|uniref:LCP family protein n=1 Tax=Microbacterium sp. CIAB417 TaxID=2860287 RepID=UPI001FAE0746|nr:LCP family protein [Microbacterium sp. CIAB417]